MKFKQCIMSINRHDLVSRLFAVALMLMTAFAVNAQTQAVSGTVTDTDGEPVIGASVMVAGSAIGTATDIDGNYSLKMCLQALNCASAMWAALRRKSL